ncbi:MAG TPA: hypothetical protein VME23_07175 [Terracidiphilus sp.]|nr:hypothetical protein [Terracidiphilus sp.]
MFEARDETGIGTSRVTGMGFGGGFSGDQEVGREEARDRNLIIKGWLNSLKAGREQVL